MTEQELAGIREMATSAQSWLDSPVLGDDPAITAMMWMERFAANVPRLLAEVERLRAENAALTPVAEFARATSRELASPRHRIAGTEVVHLPDELMAKARTLLGDATPDAQSGR